MGSHRITAVETLPVILGVTVTLVCAEQGWRFHAWHSGPVGSPGFAPSDEDCARFFETAEHAAAYFSRTYGEKLRAAMSPRRSL